MYLQSTRTLLLIEGHSGVRTALAQRLRHLSADLTVVTASSLANALSCMTRHPPAVVLCDPKSLPADGDPASIVGALLEFSTPLIVLTTAFDGHEALEWRARGVQAVLLKGIAPGVLVQCVGFACRQSQRELHLAGPPDAQSDPGQAYRGTPDHHRGQDRVVDVLK